MALDKIKKEQVDISTIDKRYASQGDMIADQAAQYDKFIYFDGTSYWEYLGTTAGTIADYRLFSFTLSNLSLEMIETASSVVKFDSYGGYIHGNAAPITTAISFDFTNAILGVVSKMKYLNNTPLVFPAESKIIAGYYSINALNYFTFELVKKDVGDEEVWVTISQE